MKGIASSGLTRRDAALELGGGRASRPRSRSASSDIASSAVAGSNDDQEPELGEPSRTARILSSCASSSANTATAPELPATHSHSSGEFVW